MNSRNKTKQDLTTTAFTWMISVSLTAAISVGIGGCSGGSAKAKKPAQHGTAHDPNKGNPAGSAGIVQAEKLNETYQQVNHSSAQMVGETQSGTGGMAAGVGSAQGTAGAAK